ncbi:MULTISPECIES: DUF2635 domain-containing protein [Marinomonas]|uniref:DUF2635 domain-containing protein n=1 Tax=Marinomonas rhodophyticola TaxID=2992803 RepID=A0ABT3KCM3_9GAMM|nr:DUF2635 domain-containing protein [Marinomonas sp. KJ51-3]MCW4628281.1 DUF2635 domain-containing protein [Marinomonas sp. KJ51-3]
MSTQEMITIKPAKAGVNVLKPDGTHLANDGETVKRSAFWVRRLSDGDIAIVQQAKTAAKKGE